MIIPTKRHGTLDSNIKYINVKRFSFFSFLSALKKISTLQENVKRVIRAIKLFKIPPCHRSRTIQALRALSKFPPSPRHV